MAAELDTQEAREVAANARARAAELRAAIGPDPVLRRGGRYPVSP